LAVGMLISCPECGHSLWAEARGVGQFDFVVYFDDERSDSYAQSITSCPTCHNSSCPTCHNWCGRLVDARAKGRHYAAPRG
jgi:hypothetical protein